MDGPESSTKNSKASRGGSADAPVFSKKAKYLYIGRDGRDGLWSMFNLHLTANDARYVTLNDTPGRVGPQIERPPASIMQYYHE